MRQLVKSNAWVLAVVVLVAVFGLAAAGCTSLSSTGTTGAGVATTITGATIPELGATTTAASASTGTTIHVDASEQLLPSGLIKACGIIKQVKVVGGVRKLTIDYVDFLTGAAADAAAIADGVISPGEHVDDDYYVRNKNNKLRTFDISNSVTIITYSRDGDPSSADPPCSWADFYGFWNLIGPPLPNDMGLSAGLWWIERVPSTNSVVNIEQQWTP